MNWARVSKLSGTISVSANIMARMLFLSLAFLAAPLGASGAVDFQQQIRPLLSDACYQCHGPDPSTRMAGLRLDVRDGAFAERPNGTPIVAGDPGAGLLYQRIVEQDAAKRMPPEYSHKELTAEQIELIRLWIEQGASWTGHWSFEPPRRAPEPEVGDPRWARNPIDRFILARLDAEALAPAPEADRRTLARRVSLDLTGLPPSPEKVEAFVNDHAPDAYEKLVDRLLSSDAYGEHRARYWLDAARYADTHGLHVDNYREMWPYRDWVVSAFNRNLPFDQFTVEQIAGDLLKNPSEAQLIATGFHRCNITTNEGGVIDDEVAAIYAKDRVDTTSMVWMGLTVGCATCHDHKFDPITQKDFYSMAAFFRNTTQAPRDGNVYDTPPILVVPADEDAQRWNELLTEIPAAERKLDKLGKRAAKGDFRKWLKSKERLALEAGRFDDSEIDALLTGNPATGANSIDAPVKSATELPDETKIEIAGVQPISADKPFTISAWVRLDESGGGRTLLNQTVYEPAPIEGDSELVRGWRFMVSGYKPSFLFIGDGGQELGVSTKGPVDTEESTWHHVAVTYDGHRQRNGLSLYLDGRRLPVTSSGKVIRVLEGSIQTEAPLMIGARVSDDELVNFLKGSFGDLRILERAATEPEIRLLSLWGGVESSQGKRRKKLSDREREALEAYFLVRRHESYVEATTELRELRDEQRAIRRRSPITHVMNERRDSEATAHILYRGMYDQPREEVKAATPSALPAMDSSLPKDRLGLALWLVDDTNPLTARVAVNRFWQQLFGMGLVKTAEDFGSQGEAPSHPELLDWLAIELRESGWDVKRLMKLLVTSASYRQSAETTPRKIEADPENRLLARGPRFRMDGEMVRDSALAAGGLLVDKLGGPSVKPYQPERVWVTVAMKGSNTRFYKQDAGEDLYRRSLYTFWKRAAPPPAMTTFNAPTREFCTVRRERTNTPLQALLTMNAPEFFEAARGLATNAMRAESDLEARLDFMTTRLLSRGFSDAERVVARDAYRDYLRYYDSNPDEAAELLSVGESEPYAALGQAELAALTMTANQLLNLDEVLNK